jgi:transcriptional repressor NrdR
MRCPFCDGEKESLKVIDSRTCEQGRAIRRRRECLQCSRRFTTYERIEENNRLSVIKKDNRRVPWDKSKILSGLLRACFKRPVEGSDVQRIADEVEEEVFRLHDREVRSETIGRLVTERLRVVDQVAYVRFASVYRQFKTLEELVAEARSVIDSQRLDDPRQGRLFIEPVVDPEESNGSGRESKGRGKKASPAVHDGQKNRTGVAGPEENGTGAAEE